MKSIIRGKGGKLAIGARLQLSSEHTVCHTKGIEEKEGKMKREEKRKKRGVDS